MSTVIGWLLPLLAGALGNAVARVFEGSCPLAPQTFVCGHWEAVCTVAAVILGFVGVKVNRQRVAAKEQGLTLPPLKPVRQTNPDALGDADPHSGP